VQGYFFNPNIHPYREFAHRLETLQEYVKSIDFPLEVDRRYLLEDFLLEALQKDRSRCESCYEIRFRQAARVAMVKNFDSFTTTLLVSPHQKHKLIIEVAKRIAREEGIEFFYMDFRPYWQTGVSISRERLMYRQPYCGCIFSEKERYCKEN